MPVLRSSRSSVRCPSSITKRHLVGAALALPFTILVLAVMALFDDQGWFADLLGLIAVGFGILGTLLFFAFLYRFQLDNINNVSQRRIVVGIHILAMLVLYLVIHWLGFFSPWSTREIWGTYDIQTASRSWIIAVLSIGTITLLGSTITVIQEELHHHEDDEARH